jgi:hypothetical protein
MPSDVTGTLCNWAQFTEGAFADLARNFTDAQVQQDFLMEATRLCEGAASGRRLAPFTLTETHRLQGIDPDEYTDAANLPLDLSGVMGRSYAYALGASTLVRHCWLNEFPPHYPEMWTYSNITVNVTRSYGGGQTLSPSQYRGPAPDSGHIWFNLGLFIPIGSYADFTYTGGYTTMPADLVRAGKNMTAALIIRELRPDSSGNGRDPDQLQESAEKMAARYARE